MDTPNHLLYTKEHEWTDFTENEIIIGITDYAQSQLGDVIFIEFPQIGVELNMGASFGEIEAVKTVSELYSPISGKVIAINETLEEFPELVNSDPYGGGWLIKIEASNIKEKDDLMNASSYKELVQ